MFKLIRLAAPVTAAVFVTSCQHHQIQATSPVSAVAAGTFMEATPSFGGKFIPARIGGDDAEFAGNGPDVSCTVNLEISGTSLIEVINFHAKETKHNWTEVRGARRKVAYTGARRILGFAPGQSIGGSVSYRDNGNGFDKATSPDPNVPIAEMKIVGRYERREAGVITGVHSITYRPVRLIVQ